MVLWINGAFGSGKTSVAEEIEKRVGKSFIYDPEQVGYFLWDNFPTELKQKGNSQHMAIWREFNYKILKHISENYTGIIIVPMAIYKKQYYDEIIGRLEKDNILVKHFILSASKQIILDRLLKRGEPDGGWCAQHIDICLNAFETEIAGHKIDAESLGVIETASKIVSLADLAE